MLYTIDSGHNRATKPLHDYECLIFDSMSAVSDSDAPELGQAIKLGLPILVLCSSGHVEHEAHDRKREYRFLEHMKKRGLDFEYTTHERWGREVKHSHPTFRSWWGHFEELKDKYGSDARRLLVVNYERDKPPQQRAPLDKYTLNHIYKKNDIAVLTSQRFIDFLDRIRRGKLSVKSFLEKIEKTSGEVV